MLCRLLVLIVCSLHMAAASLTTTQAHNTTAPSLPPPASQCETSYRITFQRCAGTLRTWPGKSSSSTLHRLVRTVATEADYHFSTYGLISISFVNVVRGCVCRYQYASAIYVLVSNRHVSQPSQLLFSGPFLRDSMPHHPVL